MKQIWLQSELILPAGALTTLRLHYVLTTAKPKIPII